MLTVWQMLHSNLAVCRFKVIQARETWLAFSSLSFGKGLLSRRLPSDANTHEMKFGPLHFLSKKYCKYIIPNQFLQVREIPPRHAFVFVCIFSLLIDVYVITTWIYFSFFYLYTTWTQVLARLHWVAPSIRTSTRNETMYTWKSCSKPKIRNKGVG